MILSSRQDKSGRKTATEFIEIPEEKERKQEASPGNQLLP
jgi:hypothetical protein